MKNRPIKVWRWNDAPKSIKYVASCDDCDWIAEVPKEILDKQFGYINWLQEGTPYGCCSVVEKPHPKKHDVVLVFGYHA